MVATDDFTVEFRGRRHRSWSRMRRNRTSCRCGEQLRGRLRRTPLELPDALRATDCPPSDVESVSLIQTHEVEPLERLLGHVPEVIGECAAPFLDGDRRSFNAARGIRAERARAYTARVVNAPAIAEADSAWQASDYKQVCKILRPIREELDDTHRRRLAFAKSKLEKTS